MSTVPYHGIPQVFVKGHIPKGAHGDSLVYGSDPSAVKPGKT